MRSAIASSMSSIYSGVSLYDNGMVVLKLENIRCGFKQRVSYNGERIHISFVLFYDIFHVTWSIVYVMR